MGLSLSVQGHVLSHYNVVVKTFLQLLFYFCCLPVTFHYVSGPYRYSFFSQPAAALTNSGP